MGYAEIYAVDFDGTLSFGKYPQIGEPNLELIEFLKAKRAAGDKVILWTCREGELLKAAVKFCNAHGLYLDAINDNIQENKEFFQSNSRKVYAHYYIDDRNFDGGFIYIKLDHETEETQMRTYEQIAKELIDRYKSDVQKEQEILERYHTLFKKWESTEDESVGEEMDKAYEAWKKKEGEVNMTARSALKYILKL